MDVSARTFGAGLLHGTIQAVNIPAVPLPVLQAMAQTDTWPCMHLISLTLSVDGVLYLVQL